MRDYFPWNATTRKRLIDLQTAGKSMSEIAATLTAEFQPITRSGIASQIATLRKCGKIEPTARSVVRDRGGHRAKRERSTSALVKAIEADQPPPMIGTVTPKQDDGKGCRFIFGDPREEFSYCGRWTIDGSPYCDGHHRICYRPYKPKEDQAA